MTIMSERKKSLDEIIKGCGAPYGPDSCTLSFTGVCYAQNRHLMLEKGEDNLKPGMTFNELMHAVRGEESGKTPKYDFICHHDTQHRLRIRGVRLSLSGPGVSYRILLAARLYTDFGCMLAVDKGFIVVTWP